MTISSNSFWKKTRISTFARTKLLLKVSFYFFFLNLFILGSIEVDEKYVVENGFPSKLFGMLTVEVESQNVSSNRNRFEYYLADYLYKIGNFDENYISSAFNVEGYFDLSNYGKSTMSTTAAEPVVTARRVGYVKTGDKYKYDFCIIPTVGFLSSPLPLYRDCEVKLSFDRVSAKTSVIEISAGGTLPSVFTIDNVVAETEYISSPALRNHFSSIEREPIVYRYEDIEVLIKPLPKDQTNIRLDNIYGGNVPFYFFSGIIKTEDLAGNEDGCSTMFSQHHVTDFNLTLNGSSVNGYPLSTNDSTVIFPLMKFLDTSGRLYNIGSGSTLSIVNYDCNYLWAHRFEAEEASSGWLGIELKLKENLTENYSIVVWLIKPSAITIDQFRNIEKLSL